MGKPLTAKAVQALKPRAAPYEVRDPALTGAYVVVSPSGALSYVLRYRFAGAKKKLTVGKFDPATGLGDVRARAHAALADLAKARRDPENGVDPAAAKTQARRQAAEGRRAAKIDTARHDEVAHVVEAFKKQHLAKLRTGAAVARVLDREVVGRWKGRALGEINPADIHALLDEVADRAPVQSARLKAYLSKLYRFATDRQIIEKNIVENLKRENVKVDRNRSLVDKGNGDPRELILVWKVSEALGYPFEPIVKLLILTGARLSEIAKGKWSEIDFTKKFWTLSPARTKNDEEHKIPLSPAVLQILESLPRRSGCDLIFTTNGRTSVSGFSRAKRNLDKRIAALNGGIPIADWRLHDIRRSVAVGLASRSVEIHVTEKILGHSSGSFKGIVKVYQQFEYVQKQQKALTDWGEHIVSSVDEEKVVHLRQRETTS